MRFEFIERFHPFDGITECRAFTEHDRGDGIIEILVMRQFLDEFFLLNNPHAQEFRETTKAHLSDALFKFLYQSHGQGD